MAKCYKEKGYLHRQQFTNHLKLYRPNLNILNLFAKLQAKRALQDMHHLLRNARATEEVVALAPVPSLVFRNKQLLAAMGQMVEARNVSKGNHCNPQVKKMCPY